MARVLLGALLLAPLAHAQSPRVWQEDGRFWVQCQSASLEEVIREIAALSPMELWLDEGLSEKRVTATVERATLKHALEELFEKATDVNYVFAFDRSNPERVTKIYAGSGRGGRLGREPTVAVERPAGDDLGRLESVPEAAESPDVDDLQENPPEPSDPADVAQPTKLPKKDKPPR